MHNAVAMHMLEHQDTREAGVDVILTLLDSTKNYYTGGNNAYLRVPAAGLMNIMDQCLQTMLRKGRFRVFLDAFMNPTTTATSSQEGESSSPSTSAAPATSNGLDGDATENKDGDVTPVPTWRSAAKMATFYNVLCSVAHKVGYNPSTISVDHHAVVPNCIRWGGSSSSVFPTKSSKKKTPMMLRKCFVLSRKQRMRARTALRKGP